MKIEYLKLKNFSNIITAFNSNEISIDFTKSKNRIILLTGPNGSGKTSILSCLHPFATNGNLDIRNDNPLVEIGKEGYKEIILNDDGNEYIIKHFYTPSKESHTVKSYIMRNGVELNPNGNVTSFKDVVKEELDIEMDYLKLTRLGSNVTNFIDLKTTDRKAFMGKILDEVEIYLKYFKKVTNDMREVKSIISHLIDKISKLNISDVDELKSVQKKYSSKLKEYEKKIAELNSNLSIIKYEVEMYDSPLIIKEQLDEKKSLMQKINRILEKKANEDISIDECSYRINKAMVDLASEEAHLISLKEHTNDCLLSMDKLINEENNILIELNKIEDSTEVKDTKFMIEELRNKIEKRAQESNLIKYEYKVSKRELEELIIMLDKCSDILLTTYEFGQEPIKKAIEFIENRQDIMEYTTNYNKRINKNKMQAYCEFVYKEVIKSIGKVTSGCNNPCNCKVKEFYDTIEEYATEVPDIIIEDETFVTYTKMAYQNIKNIIDTIKSKKSTFDKLPLEIQKSFTIDEIFSRMINLKNLYDKELLYRELSLATDYELQEADLKELSNLKEKLNLLLKSSGNLDYFKDRLCVIKEEKENILSLISDDSLSIERTKSNISELSSLSVQLQELKESLEKKDTLLSELNELSNVYDKLRNLAINKKEIDEILSDTLYEYNKLQKEFNDNEFRLNSYVELNQELKTYNERYDDMELIKNSLSSKEGIPLLYIQIYLKNIQEITNELLNIIYDDELYIEDFNITADEFKIPFVTKGTQIRDVCYASQGERSFISLALSFALIYQSISRYNVMLLDEIDATLDTGNREKFLQILEKQMDMIDADQIFVISHNNMFNMYPVDIIDTKNKINPDNKLANYIKIEL